MDRVNGEWILQHSDKLGSTLLEVGSQIVPGQESIALRKFIGHIVKEYVGLDGQQANGVDVVADAANMPFSDNKFDSIVTLDMLEHCKYPHQVFKECFRVTKPGGYLLAATVFNFPVHSVSGECGLGGDYFRFTNSALRFLSLDAGYEIVECDRDIELSNPSIVRVVAKKPI